MEKCVIGMQAHQVVKHGVTVLAATLIIHPNQHAQNFHAILIQQPKNVQQEPVQLLLVKQIVLWCGISYNKMQHLVNG